MFNRKKNEYKKKKSSKMKIITATGIAGMFLWFNGGDKMNKFVWSMLTPEDTQEQVENEQKQIINAINVYYSKEKKKARDDIWSIFKTIYDKTDFNIKVPISHLMLYSEGEKYGYQKVLPSDYKKIIDEIGHIKTCLERIKRANSFKKKTKNNTKKYDVSNELWNSIDDRIATNKRTINQVPVLVKDYVDIIILRAKLAHITDKVPIETISTFMLELNKELQDLMKFK